MIDDVEYFRDVIKDPRPKGRRLALENSSFLVPLDETKERRRKSIRYNRNQWKTKNVLSLLLFCVIFP